MRTRTVSAIVLVCLVLVLVAFAKQPVPAPATERYHLYSFQIGHAADSRYEIFRFDSQTGQVWRYLPTGQLVEGTENTHVWKFFPVEVNSGQGPGQSEKPPQIDKQP